MLLLMRVVWKDTKRDFVSKSYRGKLKRKEGAKEGAREQRKERGSAGRERDGSEKWGVGSVTEIFLASLTARK